MQKMPDPSTLQVLSHQEAARLPKPDVIHVIDSLLGWGGAENRLVEEILNISNLRQLVVRLFERDELDHRLLEAGVPVLSLGLTKNRESVAIPIAIWRLRRVVAALRPSVLHTSLMMSNLIGQVVGATFAPRIPVVSSLTRSGDPEIVRRYFSPEGASWQLRLLDAIARSAGRMQHVSYRAVAHHVQDSACASLGVDRDRIAVIPRGVDLSRLPNPDNRPDYRSQFNLGQRPVFINVGRLARKNGQVHLVRAFGAVLRELPDAILLIAGEAQDADDDLEQALAEEGLRTSVQLVGYRSDVMSLMAAGDVVVLSSLTEGLPGVALEAMAVGTPLVAFDVPGTREATGDGTAAVLVPPGDEKALARSMVDLYRDRARMDELARKGWERIRSSFAVSAVAPRLEDLLKSAAR